MSQRGRVYVIDDDPAMRDSLDFLLGTAGLSVLDFLEKPFEDERLIGMIETAFSQGETNAKSEAISAEMVARLASLTPRERQVMQGLVTGQSNKVIAREYDISPRTVEVYRANVMTKMQASSLSELVRFAIRAGVFED